MDGTNNTLQPKSSQSEISLRRSGAAITAGAVETRLTAQQKQTLLATANRYLANNFALTPLNGKVPAKPNWQNNKNSQLTAQALPHWLEQPDYPNFGFVIPKNIIIVDVDPRNFKLGVDSLDSLSNTIGQNLTEIANFKVKTGSDGLHLYFKIPAPYLEKKAKFALKLKGFAGIEFKTIGGQVVIPGSLHPTTNKVYEETIDSIGLAHIGDAPQALLDLLARNDINTNITAALGANIEGLGFTDEQIDIEKCRSALAVMPASIEREGGDNQLYQAACLGKDYGLSPRVFYPLLVEYNQKSQPRWSDEELKAKMSHAYKYAKNALAAKSIADFGDVATIEEALKEVEDDATTAPTAAWIGSLQRTKSGEVKANYANAILFLEHMDIFVKSLAINIFNGKLVYRKPLPWHKEYSIGIKEFPTDGRALDDDEILYIKRYFVEHNDIDFTKNILMEAVRSVALFNQFHPVRDMLQGLKWDGTPRIDKWLTTYLSAEDNIYTQAVGKKFLLAAVTRIFEPGAKFDTMMILEGKEQGKGKSTTLDILSHGWFIDNINDFQSKDTLLACHNGIWIAECAELDFMSKVEITAQKSFASRRIDSFRAPYDRFVKDYPRQFVMVGTTNQFQYLRDETGNRRYWPVRTHDIYLQKLREDVSQLWAEAYELYKRKSYTIYMDSEELIQLSNSAQADRMQDDAWSDSVQDWLNNEPKTGQEREIKAWNKKALCFVDIWEFALGRNPGHFPKQDQNRIGAIMRQLNYEYKMIRDEGKRYRGFVKC